MSIRLTETSDYRGGGIQYDGNNNTNYLYGHEIASTDPADDVRVMSWPRTGLSMNMLVPVTFDDSTTFDGGATFNNNVIITDMLASGAI